MILKATEMEIDTTWLCDVLFVDKFINRFLNINNKELVCGVVFGFKEEESRKKGRYKKEYLIIGEENEKECLCSNKR